MKLRPVFFASIAAASLCVGGVAQAAVVGLFNTGVDGSGIALGGGNGVTDSHYSYSIPSAGLSGSAVTYFNSSYAPNTSGAGGSQWISVNSNGANGQFVNENVDFRTTFSVTAGASYTISGMWGADNVGTILLDGNPVTGGSIAFGFSAFQAPLQSFDFTVAGGTSHTLDFIVQNQLNPQTPTLGDGPLALRVENLAFTAAVPEPATWGMLILGFAGMGLLAYRRKSKAPEWHFASSSQ